MTPSIAAGRAGKARLFEYTDVRVRAARARREAQGSRANRMLARPPCLAPMVLATFAETKVARSPGRRAEKDRDVGVRRPNRQLPAIKPLDAGLRRHDEQSHSIRLDDVVVAKKKIPGSALRAAPE